MAEAIPPLRSLPPDAPLPLPAPFLNPNPNSSTSLPSSSRTPDQADVRDQVEFPYRFQRTDLWRPAYDFLESLEKDTLVTQKEVSDWLDANPGILERLSEKHSRYHLVHYTQRMHLKMLKKRGKLPKSLQLSEARASIKPSIGSVTKQRISIDSRIKKRDAPIPGSISGSAVKEKKMLLSKKKEAFIKYELLTDLHDQLINILAKHKSTSELKQHITSSHHADKKASDVSLKHHLPDLPRVESKPEETVPTVRITGTVEPRAQLEGQIGHKRKRNPVIVTPAWSYNEVPSGGPKLDQPSSSDTEETQRRPYISIWKGETESERSPLEGRRKSIVHFVQGQERGASWRISSSFHNQYAGRGQESWVSFYRGWNSLSKQFEGPIVDLKRRCHKSWVPTWCAYTSNVASGQSTDRQSPQKVLHVKFHPEGLPQIVCGSNKGPNELLLYNLRSGRALQLKGHTSLIQAVDFAVRGASVVSCSSNLVKVWDCITGSCLYTLGGDDQNSTGHAERITAMAVNRWQSCLIVTSGAKGDGKLLLWNALRGELIADLNSNLRSQNMVCPSILTMEFCKENLLICGSDTEHGTSSVVQLWDVDCPQSCLSFSASDSYVSSLKVSPSGRTVITGSGDGTIDLFDIRTRSPINHLSVGPGSEDLFADVIKNPPRNDMSWSIQHLCFGSDSQDRKSEVTSVSFSGCGTYFSASSTSNSTLVWDTRFVPTNTSKDMRFFRPLHCLSHSDKNSSGNHGVNDARWLQSEPVLVTVSSDGSMAMWDVTLGRPFVRRALSHTRSVNTVDVALNGEYLCTGGDDQKIVLYHNKSGRARLNWRLSHPMMLNDQ